MRVNKYFTYVCKHVNPYTRPGADEPRGDPSRGGEHAGRHAHTAPRPTDPTLGRTRVPGPCASSKLTALLPSLPHTVPSHTLAKGRRGKLGREGREGPAGLAPMPSASGQEEAAHEARPGRGVLRTSTLEGGTWCEPGWGNRSSAAAMDTNPGSSAEGGARAPLAGWVARPVMLTRCFQPPRGECQIPLHFSLTPTRLNSAVVSASFTKLSGPDERAAQPVPLPTHR